MSAGREFVDLSALGAPNPRARGWGLAPIPPGVILPAGAEGWRKGKVAAIRWHQDGRWRLSVSAPSRWPTWTELEDARRSLLPPQVFMAAVFPPDGHRLRMYDGTAHLLEVKDPGLERLAEDVRFMPRPKT